MNNFFKFIFDSLLGCCILLGIGLTIIFASAIGEKEGGAGFIIALGLFVIQNQFKPVKEEEKK